MSDTRLSRSGRTNPDGKLTQRLDIPLSEELYEHVIAMAVAEGVSKAEWVRGVLEEALYGRLGMVRRIAPRGRLRPSDEYPDADRGTS
ncbi:hypothetical protein BN948_01773 [Hydrogenophaga intermedia]|uniref:Uncharacterized protein n=1 Tax=Hydrogenophaga intermedia TaxID=65786 RepID=A0A1L1PRY0_HYDIT|nr:hypothetical protein [Hydrogenophaga intermedia]CDN87351.1 hypothetical protein BN948_01773 [Hydrogenophaga intermedia]